MELSLTQSTSLFVLYCMVFGMFGMFGLKQIFGLPMKKAIHLFWNEMKFNLVAFPFCIEM